MFYKPDYKSCTKLIADTAREKYGFDTGPLTELIHWGDIIDGAQFPTAESAVALVEPATQLALVIEAAPEDGVPAQIIRDVAYKPLAEVVKLPIVAKHLGPLLERHRRSIDILRERIEARDGVIFFDVSDLDLEGYNKFVPYLLHPECVYSVSVSSSAVRAKVSLGTNPWNLATADQNLASLAEKYGGGGHQRVAAISFDPAEIARAREVARGLVELLRKPASESSSVKSPHHFSLNTVLASAALLPYSWNVLGRGAELMSSVACNSEQLRRPSRKGAGFRACFASPEVMGFRVCT